jgi:hypothetical protein
MNEAVRKRSAVAAVLIEATPGRCNIAYSGPKEHFSKPEEVHHTHESGALAREAPITTVTDIVRV